MLNTHTTRALTALWLNAAFLPIAAAVDITRALTPPTPADDADSGAPKGATVVALDDYREANNG